MLNASITLLLRNNIALSILFFLPLMGVAQYINVQDTVFRKLLCDGMPVVMSESCDQLDTIKAAQSRHLGQLNLSSQGITHANEIIHFVYVDSIYLNKNQLLSFPQDISKIRNINRLNLTLNKLTTAPDIKYTNDFGVDTAVKLFYIEENLVDRLPPSWNEPNNFTQVVDLRDNLLTEIPSFVNYPEIRRLDVSSNYLTFEELLPIKGHSKWATEQFDLFPQKQFDIEVDTLLKIGDVVEFDFAGSLNSNHYVLVKDGQEIDSNDTGVFNDTVNSMEYFGVYWVKAFNDNFLGTDEYLETVHYTIQLDYDQIDEVKKDIIIFSPNGDGQADEYLIEGEGSAFILDKNGKEVRVENLPYVWHGDDSSGKLLEPGLYIIKKSEAEFMKILLVR